MKPKKKKIISSFFTSHCQTIILKSTTKEKSKEVLMSQTRVIYKSLIRNSMRNKNDVS